MPSSTVGLSRHPVRRRLEIVKRSRAFTIQNGQSAGELVLAGEVVNRGGAASLGPDCPPEVFAPNGSRLRGVVVELVGRSRLNTNTQLVRDWTLGPGETGCFTFTVGQASAIGRYDVWTSFEAEPTTRLKGQLQAEITCLSVRRRARINQTGLVAFLKATNVGPTTDSLEFGSVGRQERRWSCGRLRTVARLW